MVCSIKSAKKIKRKSKGSDKGDGSSSSSSSIPSMPAKVWQPGVEKLEEGEELQCDPLAYNSLHAFHIGWPCIRRVVLFTVSILYAIHWDRSEWSSHNQCISSWAEKASWNSIGIFKTFNITGKRREPVPSKPAAGNSDMESDSSDSDKDDEDEELGGFGSLSLQGALSVFNQAPLVKFKHKYEGYCIDWNPIVPGRLVSTVRCCLTHLTWSNALIMFFMPEGDCNNCIYLWEPTSDATWNVDTKPFIGHAASYIWSPTEPHVFASCSVDGTIAIWDARLGKSAAASFKAHNANVSVISWNRLASCMLASGSDDGTFSIHDLILLKEGDSVVAHFECHKHPIKSIEWSPHEASILAIELALKLIWDLSLEKDDEEEAEFRAKTKEQGQKDLNEIHWHLQIPRMIVSTAAEGFNILMPSNIQPFPQMVLETRI
ncbi:hypothetical protein I3842_01G081100 [Carya illinoinensis]|uniref:Uncharacterized protein n=1 Tax=Carya illinoinensis TaxID=32201 RepID=A0A922K2N7_CARIL|nr:hypothetical protein I3842_01G081100 [Carya illinoinensis]